MKTYNELDKATLKVEFKKMHEQIGLEGCLQVLYEFLFSASTLLEVITENLKNGNQ